MVHKAVIICRIFKVTVVYKLSAYQANTVIAIGTTEANSVLSSFMLPYPKPRTLLLLLWDEYSSPEMNRNFRTV